MNDRSLSPVEHVCLRVASTFENLERLVERMQVLASRHAEDEETAYRVVLATSEAVTNAMEHGNAFDDAKMTVLEFAAYTNRMEVTVIDEGSGFERREVDNPLNEERMLLPHGRGLYIIEELADEVRYDDEGRQVRMIFCCG